MTNSPSTEIDLETYRRSFYASPYYITISRLDDGTLIDVNPGFEKFTGLKRKDVLGKTVTQLNLWISQEERDRFISTVLREGQIYDYETFLKNYNGEFRHILASANVDEVNGVKILVAVVLDVTEQRKSEAEVLKHKLQLEQMVIERTKELNIALEKLQASSRLDGLTGLMNRDYFDKAFELEWKRAYREKSPISIIMLDIDYFKKVNDTYGHLGGDACLKQVACIIKKTAERNTDMIFRYGGEEFTILMSNTTEFGASHVAENIRKQIQNMTVVFEDKIIPLTVSLGVSSAIPEVEISSLVKQADSALYEAKNTGRNKFCVKSYE